MGGKTLFGRCSEIKPLPFAAGRKRVLFEGWGAWDLDGLHLELEGACHRRQFESIEKESLWLVEAGSLEFRNEGQSQHLRSGHAIKVFPGCDPELRPAGEVRLFVVQMAQGGETLARLRSRPPIFVHHDDLPSQVSEYETLAQEVMSCNYSPGIGLMRFILPIDRIPIHQHPFAARLIRPQSGAGYTYVAPERVEMDPDSFALFDQGLTHTNGPLPGNVYTIWAVQIPWIDPGIDETDIGGQEEFIRYSETVPPRELWKKKDEFLRVIRKLS